LLKTGGFVPFSHRLPQRPPPPPARTCLLRRPLLPRRPLAPLPLGLGRPPLTLQVGIHGCWLPPCVLPCVCSDAVHCPYPLSVSGVLCVVCLAPLRRRFLAGSLTIFAASCSVRSVPRIADARHERARPGLAVACFAQQRRAQTCAICSRHLSLPFFLSSRRCFVAADCWSPVFVAVLPLLLAWRCCLLLHGRRCHELVRVPLWQCSVW
jgi:hypothetical protein